MISAVNFAQVEFSPFFENRLACASAANFGIAGNGRLWAMNVSNEGIAAITLCVIFNAVLWGGFVATRSPDFHFPTILRMSLVTGIWILPFEEDDPPKRKY
ncbi:hypothetical protein HDU81_007769 [Chytriomyces hyalinus]|nr:hypothetical protein HDU81_007769 [Chytriomyces hyalinus]